MDEKDISRAEEIAAYYRMLRNSEEETEASQEEEFPEPEVEEEEGPGEELEEENAEEVSETEEDYEEEPYGAPKGRKAFFVVPAIIAAAVLFAAFFYGFFSVRPGKDIDRVYLKLLKTDAEYLDIYKKSEKTSSELENTKEELEAKRKESEDLMNFVEQQAQIQQKIYELQTEDSSLTSSAEEKEKTSETLSQRITAKTEKSVTLDPGIYSVGRHIAEGEYSVTGDGSFNLSDGEGGLLQSAMLTREGIDCILSDGNILKIETKAVFERREQE